MDEHRPADAAEIAELRRRLEHLEHTLATVVQHVNFLERTQAPVPSPRAAARAAPTVVPRPAPTAHSPAATASVPRPAAVLPAPATPRPSSRPATPPTGAEAFEFEVALKWMARVGVVALLVAVAFFLQYAFRTDLIGPLGQVGIGLAAGLVLLLGGEINRRLGRIAYGECLLGGGLAILYTSIYAAFAFYRPPLIGATEAFGLMVCITAAGVAMAVRANALSTVIMATLGGFLTPVLVQQSGSGSGLDGLEVLFGYIAVLDFGLLAVSFFRQWRAVQIISFTATWIMVWGWMQQHYTTDLLWPVCGVAAGFFVIFTLVPVIHNLWRKLATGEAELFLILANPACFFPTTAWLLQFHYREYLGAFAVVMALLYMALGSAAWWRNRSDTFLNLTWLGTGITFAIAAVPLQLEGLWVMLGWAAEGVVVVLVGQQLRSDPLRAIGLILQAAVAGWLFTLDFHHREAGALPVLNQTFLSFASGVAALGITYAAYARSREPMPEWARLRPVLSVAIAGLVLWGPTMEMYAVRLVSAWMLMYWAAAGAATVALGHYRRVPALYVFGLVVQGVMVAWMLTIYSATGRGGYLHIPVVNPTFLAFLAGLASLAVTYAISGLPEQVLGNAKALRNAIPVAVPILFLWGSTAELTRSLGAPAGLGKGSSAITNFAVSAWWCIYATLLVALGIARRSVAIRIVGIGVFGLAILKVFIPDVWFLDPIWRILSFFCLGLILIGVVWAYNVYAEKLRLFGFGKQRPVDEEKPE